DTSAVKPAQPVLLPTGRPLYGGRPVGVFLGGPLLIHGFVNQVYSRVEEGSDEKAGGRKMGTMKAVRIHSFGGREGLRYEDAPRPEPGAGEVLIRVQAAGVNPVDWKVREGYLEDFLPHKLPLILGWDVAGVIEAVGEGAGDWKPGEEVFVKLFTGKEG